MQELFKLNDQQAVCCNPGGRFHGWLFRKHADGSYVSERKLEVTEPFPKDHPFYMPPPPPNTGSVKGGT